MKGIVFIYVYFISFSEFLLLAKPASSISEVEGTKSVEVGKPSELDCEATGATVPAYWEKDGEKLPPQNQCDTKSDGKLRRLTVQSAELLHLGRYSCEASDETNHFTVDPKGD